MEIKLEEVQQFGLVSCFLGAIICITVCSWDMIAGRMFWRHSLGLGWQQILLIAASGIYTFWAYCIHLKWKEYRKMIHKMGA